MYRLCINISEGLFHLCCPIPYHQKKKKMSPSQLLESEGTDLHI